MIRDSFDVVIVGGGIAGGALATVLARAGQSVLVLERAETYEDRVRGEYMAPWGVAETQRLDVFDALLDAGGNVLTRMVPYDETVEPADAEAAAVALDEVLPGVPGSLAILHPTACATLTHLAQNAGAQFVRPAREVQVSLGSGPSVGWSVNGRSHTTTCQLIVGADGRESSVRKQADIPLLTDPPRLLGAGLLVSDLAGWPIGDFSVGTEDDRLFFIIPQGRGLARLYLMYDVADRRRLAGTDKAARFLDDFSVRCVPGSEQLAGATPAGPCAAFPMNDSWTDPPLRDGVVLIGDAGGYSDPQLGQGLSVAMRDVRVLSELLLERDDWSPAGLEPYASERRERMRRLRWVNQLVTTLRGEFGPEARERRRRAQARMRSDPELARFRRATLSGPESVPPDAFDDSVRERVLAGS